MGIRAKTAVVTGASAGIGRAIAERLSADGFDLITIDRERPKATLAGETFLRTDLLMEGELQEVLSFLREKPGIDVLVNNVAIVRLGQAEAISVEDMQLSMSLNVEVPLRMMQAVVGGMKQKGYGRLVNIASRAALGKELRTAYSASKAALIGMTRTWALEFGKHGITANCVAPGPIATDMFMKSNPVDSEQTRLLMQSILMRKLGSPSDIAHAVSYLSDERTGFMTGQTLYVCGGLSVGLAA